MLASWWTRIQSSGNLADAWRFTGKSSNDVIRTYQRAAELALADLTINPRDVETRGNYALYLAWQGEAKPSIREIERAMAEAPTNVNLLFLSVLVYELAGQQEAAWNALKASLDRNYPISEVERHPDLEGLRKDPRSRPCATCKQTPSHEN
jgi:thioredoxin-like negative regulator of GroEL